MFHRFSYIKSSDIAPISQRLIEQIRNINKIRSTPGLEHEQNKGNYASYYFVYKHF